MQNQIQYLKHGFLLIILINLFFACVKENADPPGCETPPAPTISAPVTTFREGQTAVLNALPPEGASGGSFEWNGPNNYLSFNNNAVLGKMSAKNAGEYKLYYLDENNCRSLPATVFIALNSEGATCGLSANRIYIISENFITGVQNVEEVNLDGKFAIDINQSNVRLQIKFPNAERPKVNTLYKIAADSVNITANEVDIKMFYNQKWYRAVNSNKNVQVFLGDNASLYIVLCENIFAETSNTNNTLTASLNILSQ